jgi:hypothetical protein
VLYNLKIEEEKKPGKDKLNLVIEKVDIQGAVVVVDVEVLVDIVVVLVEVLEVEVIDDVVVTTVKFY